MVTSLTIQGLVYRNRDNGFEAAAADLRNLLKRLFDYAIECGVCDTNPARSVGLRFTTRARSRTRALSPDEIRTYLGILYRSNIRRQFKLALHLLLLTMTRKSELLLARSKEVHFAEPNGTFRKSTRRPANQTSSI